MNYKKLTKELQKIYLQKIEGRKESRNRCTRTQTCNKKDQQDLKLSFFERLLNLW